MPSTGPGIKMHKIFDGVTVNNNTVTSRDIPLKDLANLGYFGIQVSFDSVPTGDPSINFNVIQSYDGTNFVTPSGVAAIKTAHLKSSGSSGLDIYSFNPKPAEIMRITALETASQEGIITVWLLTQ